MEELKYPIGKFRRPEQVSSMDIQNWILAIKTLPADMRSAVAGLNESQLDTPYREGGWTVRQVVHHVADSHMNSFIRFKLALTEDNPTIKPYLESLWAEQPDYNTPVEFSLNLLDGLHARMTVMLEHLKEEDWGKTFVHPERGRIMRLDVNLSLYAWHGKHHIAHIIGLRTRNGW